MNNRSENDAIRAGVMLAVSIEEPNAPFLLLGRGHEPRVTLDRKLAAVLRTVEIPFIKISGYGPNKFYPLRVFAAARNILTDTLGWSPIELSDHGSCYRIDRDQYIYAEKTKLRTNPSRLPNVIVYEQDQDNMCGDWIDQVSVSRNPTGALTVLVRKNKQDAHNPSRRSWAILTRVPGIRTPDELVKALEEAEASLGVNMNWATVVQEVSALDWAISKAIAFGKRLPGPVS